MGESSIDGPAAAHLVGVVVELQVINPDDGVVVEQRLGAAEDGPDPGHDLVEAEGLGDVVVAADGEAGDLVLGVVLRGQEQDGEVLAGCPELAR